VATRILVVVDEPSPVASLSYTLGRAGFQVRETARGVGYVLRRAIGLQ
jgi:DNA-binding response OmpR family regulator